MMYEDEYNQNSKITKKSKKKTELNEENDSAAHHTSLMCDVEYNQNSKITKKSKKKTELNEENDSTAHAHINHVCGRSKIKL